ncbi:flagellar M-ring protein FliF [Tissierella sp. MSJ-40]|uniref:Flagellar M-ring protein n=1 Tax=Tissierella simiarum TaxID=2841534 RepID=A0ABS6E4L6_9FIRM|nr:flagellar M-ring protein FliF [Tissierella simiarum]
MGETIQQVRQQLNSFWQEMDKKKKIKLGIIGLLIILTVTILILIFTRPKYEVLYENLTLKDTAQVTKKLDEMNVKWKTGENDSSILVPSEVKNKVKIELASYGLPKEGYSFMDAFNDSSWTMTDYDKKQRMKYALQSELSATISEIDGIESATVYIDEKEDTNFVLSDKKEQTTASVFIKKDDNRPLSGEKVNAIKNLVAGSISMDIENVLVIDDEGKLLTEEQDGADFVMTDQFTIKQNLELRINESIKRFLENVFGYGNVDIRASVKINFDSERTTIVEFAPPIEGNEEGLIRSLEEVEEHMVGGGTGGVPGETTNPVEDYQMVEDGNSRYDKVSRIINNELNEINKEIKKAPGQVETITVAVLINKDTLADGELTPEREKEIADLIYAATGLDTKQVQVRAERFTRQEMPVGTKADKGLNWLGIGLIVALLAGGTTGYVLVRRKKSKMDELERVLEEKTLIQAEVEDLNFEAEESKMKAQIDKFIEMKPDSVAQLLRSWLNE